jgi:hypothetical protein
MNTNAMDVIIIPIVAGVGLGTVVGLAIRVVMGAIDALAVGRDDLELEARPVGGRRRWRPVVVGFGQVAGARRFVFGGPARRRP